MRNDLRITLWATMLLLMAGCTHVRDPLQAWLQAGHSDRYRAPSPAESAALADAFAQGLGGEAVPGWADLGYEVRVTDGEYAVRETAPQTRGWGAFAYRTGPARALVVQAPHGDSDRRTGDIAFVLYRESHARLLAVNSAHRSLDGADQANVDGAPFVLLGHEAAHPWVGAVVVQVHGFGPATAARYGLSSRSVVVSNGTHTPDPALRQLAGCLAHEGFEARLFPVEAPYPGGTRNAVRAAMAAAGGGRFVHLELGEGLREELAQSAAGLRSFAACL